MPQLGLEAESEPAKQRALALEIGYMRHYDKGGREKKNDESDVHLPQR
jgi:hypothetical protein